MLSGSVSEVSVDMLLHGDPQFGPAFDVRTLLACRYRKGGPSSLQEISGNGGGPTIVLPPCGADWLLPGYWSSVPSVKETEESRYGRRDLARIITRQSVPRASLPYRERLFDEVGC